MLDGRQKATKLFLSDYRYFVIQKQGNEWQRISDEYPDLRGAQDALKELRKTHPDARLGGTRVD